MKRLFYAVMPLLPLALSVLALIETTTAVQAGHWGRAAFKGFTVLVWLFVAYMLYATSKRIGTDDP